MHDVTPDNTLEEKLDWARGLLGEALDRWGGALRLAWTGGKDSTLLLWLLREVSAGRVQNLPECVFIDEGSVFPEVEEFVARVTDDLGLTVVRVRNDDVVAAAGGVLGAAVRVADLSDRNRREVARLGFEGNEFPYEPESLVGNHLMKTVPLNLYIEGSGARALVTGIRWDEQGARGAEIPLSEREDPPHVRVHPLLPFTERDVWDAHDALEVPACVLYERGYRSLGAAASTARSGDAPAWEQDLEGTAERGGRRQDKEGLMDRLRDLGYM